MKIYAGIGARITPANIQAEMSMLAEHLANLGWLLRSGHAEGADQAFENGAAHGNFISYLPYAGFNNPPTDSRFVVPKRKPWMEKTIEDFHPAPQKLSADGYKMMLRNACQVLGEDGVISQRANVVICWTKEAAARGGTGQAIRIARGLGIPVIDMAIPQLRTKDMVLKRLVELKLLD